MRAFAILAMIVLLGGCESLFYLDSDSFSPGHAPYEVFVEDSRLCAKKADDFVNYNPIGMGGTSYHRRRAYNRTYAACMKGDGYARRGWAANLVP